MVSQEELKAFVDSMPEEMRAKSQECAVKMLALIEEYDDAGLVALAIVGASIEQAAGE